MSVYITMTILAVAFSAIANITTYNKQENGKSKIDTKLVFWYLSELVLIIIAAIRYDVGQDYMYTYVPFFNGVLWGNINENVEVGFLLLNKIVQIFTQDYVGIFIVCSVIFFHYIYKAIREQSPMPTLSIFLLVGTTYYFVFLNAMRQMMVVAIFLYAIKFIQERKLVKYLIYMLIASTIHTSALVLIPLYFLYGIKLRPIKILSIVAVLIAMKPVITSIMLKIIQATKYSYYIDSQFDTQEVGYIVLAINVVVLIFSMIYLKKYDVEKDSEQDIERQKKYSFYCLLQLISTVIAWYNGAVPLLNRIRWGTGISIIILIPYIIKKERNQKLRMLYTFIIVLAYTLYTLYTVGMNNSNNVLPYMTIFQRGV